MFNRILQWLCDILGPEKDGNYDVTIEDAKKNYQKYQDEVKERMDKYIKTVCFNIKTKARSGSKDIRLDDLPKELDRSEYIQEIKKYFESRGFTVTTRYEDSIFYQTEIKISWVQE
jgi:hypothetical protein